MLTVRDLIPWGRDREVAQPRGAEHPLMAFRREMDRLFDDMWRGFDVLVPGRADRPHAMMAPRIELTDSDGEVVVSAELPGLQQKDVEISLTDNILTIRGEKKLEKSEKEGGYTYSERSYGSFQRRIALDAEVVADKVTASFADGVLTVRLPKQPTATKSTRRIAIDGGPAEAGAPADAVAAAGDAAPGEPKAA
jgi:HSP20 family protein